MKMTFYKYQGTGNDFVIIDGRTSKLELTKQNIAQVCNRHFGVGADGFIILEQSNDYDFYMKYFNSDGGESTMCGNGGRSIVRFAHDIGIVTHETTFEAIDGIHGAKVEDNQVVLGMSAVKDWRNEKDYTFLNTGSPHHVEFHNHVSDLNVYELGRKVRNSELYGKEGSNINFVEILTEDKLFVRTYERGVEDETLSCGTGIVASVLSYGLQKGLNRGEVYVKTKGGELSVQFERTEKSFENIYLKGPAKFVFKGEIKL